MCEYMLHFQNLGLEAVGVKMNKNGAIEVLCLIFISSYISLSLSYTNEFSYCLNRLTNSPKPQFLPFGLLGMLRIGSI